MGTKTYVYLAVFDFGDSTHIAARKSHSSQYIQYPRISLDSATTVSVACFAANRPHDRRDIVQDSARTQ